MVYYPLDDGSGMTAIDLIGGHDGVLQGNVDWDSGKLGGGLKFTRTAQNGTFAGPDYKNGWIEANSLLDGVGASGVLNDTDSYTFSAWPSGLHRMRDLPAGATQFGAPIQPAVPMET